MIVNRNLEPKLRQAAGQWPILTITGPRQSGKTTLVKTVFENHAYVNLELPHNRAFASEDPQGFLKQFRNGVIIDEVQYVPELLSYIQTIVDDNPVRGRWILTGSQNFTLLERISQSLAGRTSLHQLHPLSWDEVSQFPQHPEYLEQALYTGGYPRIFAESHNPTEWLGDYIQTYLQRDVRTLSNIGNLDTFERFIQLCAGRSGGLIKYSTLATDCGISQPTARAWISVLEASFVLVRVSPFHGNTRKRVTKMPKLYFLDTGLLCYLIGIREPEHILSHPLRGQIFETWVVAEIMKSRFNIGVRGGLHFYRDHNGIEVDLVIPEVEKILLVEAKSNSTPSSSLLRGTRRVKKHLQHLPQSIKAFVVYGGDSFQQHKDGAFIPWRKLNLLWQPLQPASKNDKAVVIMVSAESQPLSGVDVLTLFPNKTWVAASTDEHGVARLQLHSVELPMVVYAASTGFAAHLENGWVPQERNLQIALRPLAGGGSVIFRNATGEIPDVSGKLNPIFDTLNRSYLYADNIAINDGEQQPVEIEFGETIHLMDALGQERCIRVIGITGRAALLEYEPIE